MTTTTQTFGAPQQPLGADDDTVHGEASTLPLIIFGGQGNDTIFGGSGGDVIFGDRGRVSTSTAHSEFGHGGLGDRTDGVARGIVLAQTRRRRGSAATTRSPRSGGDDVLFGGSGADTIDAGDGAQRRASATTAVVPATARATPALAPLPRSSARHDARADVRRRRPDHRRRRPTTCCSAAPATTRSWPAAATTSCSATTARSSTATPRLADRLQFVRTSDFNDGGRDRLEGGAGDDLLDRRLRGRLDRRRRRRRPDLRRPGQPRARAHGALHDPRPLPLDGAHRRRAGPGRQGPDLRRRLHRRRRGRRPDLRPARQRRAARRRRARGPAGRRLAPRRAPATRSARCSCARPSSALTDGNDYIEGGGGDDVLFGGLGQRRPDRRQLEPLHARPRRPASRTAATTSSAAPARRTTPTQSRRSPRRRPTRTRSSATTATSSASTGALA